MKIAIHKSGKQVEVLAINGGWSTILLDGEQKKVRNSEISGVREIEQEPIAVAKAPKAPKAPREKKPLDINTRKNGKVDSIYLLSYVPSRVQLSDGTKKRALDCGDSVASALRTMTIHEVYVFAADVLRVSEKDLRTRYENLNTGMQRMNLGNIIRKAMRDNAQNA